MMCLLNVITALLLLQGFLSSASSRSKLSTSHLNSGLVLSLSVLFFVCREGALMFLQMKNKLSHGYSVSLQSMLTHHLNFLTF